MREGVEVEVMVFQEGSFLFLIVEDKSAETLLILLSQFICLFQNIIDALFDIWSHQARAPLDAVLDGWASWQDDLCDLGLLR